MTQAWNASVEQQLTNVMAIRLAYVGSESYHQSYVQDDNFAGYSYCTSYNNPNCPAPTPANQSNGTLKSPVAPYSAFTGILEYDSGATANYHSLQATFQRHMAHGLQAQSSFTWQKTMDVASAANIAASQNGIDNPREPALEPRRFQCQYSAHLDNELYLPHSGVEGAEPHCRAKLWEGGS